MAIGRFDKFEMFQNANTTYMAQENMFLFRSLGHTLATRFSVIILLEMIHLNNKGQPQEVALIRFIYYWLYLINSDVF